MILYVGMSRYQLKKSPCSHIFDPEDYKNIFENLLQNNMTPQIHLQEFSSLVFTM